MPNNNGNQKNRPVFTAQTKKIERGNIVFHNIKLKNVQIPLFVLFAYGGTGASDFKRAAEHKRSRILKKYPNAEVRIIKGFEHPPQFKAEWTKLYNELTNAKTAAKYALWQVHYFGHGSHESLIFRNNKKICFDKEDNIKRLPWHPNEGIFVLHSCRGSAYEDTLDITKIKNQICLAKTISELQETRCLGQVTYANFAGNVDEFSNLAVSIMGYGQITASNSTLDNASYKYRPKREINKMIMPFTSCALWGYALSTGETYKKTLINMNVYKEEMIKRGVLNPIYPIYEEIKKLAPKNQILPCRVFNKGKLEGRIVKVDVFNQNDLEYL
ncbi:hypothetical protein J3U21_10760 [Gilliamella sp. B2776]|uniref:hypothetical protein n=1 Tax=unclassified Gilliamella TaxID=2685620 RepID=UPI00226A4CD7|nr:MULTISPECIES: hypothetical protein [unclassified Gilliamella]MCX8650825.1 hypothetical protein [Gilliamella sp. B2779]MCX8654196.1 hypothetical protein [Gilliamella sp. B2737]MCX8657150.1 hypothetical protein [Gilliamella sp. B2894]MCX8664856.1 hypothetical protein [Gilliamella sp. B2887]MCX8692631.1 hypothetical protein [Gilliamella sp. B2776]